MDKCEDKFCPDCGHHLYRNRPRSPWYFCVECNTSMPEQDAATFAQVLDLRAGRDAQERKDGIAWPEERRVESER